MPRKVVVVIALGLLLFLVGYSWLSIRTTAPTFDEGAHLPAGYVQVVTGSTALNPEHPPLLKFLAAIPVALKLGSSAIDELEKSPGDQWELGRVLMSENGRQWQEALNPARMVTVLFTVLLCVVSAIWAGKLGGNAAGLITMALCVFCPTILAHGRLVTTDVPVAACAILASYLGWRLIVNPRPLLSVIFGIALGMTLTTKFSGILIVASLSVLCIILALKRANKSRETLAALALALVTCACTIPLVYGSLDGYHQYIHGISMLGYNHQPNFKVFLFGHYQVGGFWWYFPFAFLVKASPAVLVSIPVALLAYAFLPKSKNEIQESASWWFLLLPLLVYGVFIMWGAPQFGVRYLIPCLPFLFILLGVALARVAAVRFGKAFIACVVIAQVHAAISSYPDPISYFNGLFGCQGRDAVRCLDDSNLDWGQDLGHAAEFVNTLGTPPPPVRLLYFGTADPGAFFKEWGYMEPEELLSPAPVVYVMSLQLLQRYSMLGGIPEKLKWERRFTPKAYIGNTYVVYDFRR